MLLAIRSSFATKIEYNNKKADWLVAAEGPSNEVYLDSAGIATVGIGWNISIKENLATFMEDENGLHITHSETGDGVDLTNDQFDTLVNKILSYTSVTGGNGGEIDTKTTQEQTLIDNINAAMHEKDGNGDYLYPNLQSKNFAFSDLDQQKRFLQAAGDQYDDKLITQLRANGILGATEDFPYSYERIALWSLTYNLGSLTGGMIDALEAGNRMDMWFQIRYNSCTATENGVQTVNNGLVTRRFAEATMFGLYGNGDMAPQAASIIGWLEGELPDNTSQTVKNELGGTYSNVLQYLVAFEEIYFANASSAIATYSCTPSDHMGHLGAKS